MRKLRGFVVVAGLAGLAWGVAPSGLVSAQEQATEFNFTDAENVSGNLMRPDGEVIDVPRSGRRPSLIRIRESFIPEMLRSAENL